MHFLALAVFATIDESAIDALKHAAESCDPDYECGGVVRRVPGGFQASQLITSYKPFGVDFGPLYDGPNVVADFHTHICSIHNRAFADFFSPADASVNQGLHTVGYMLSLCDHNIRRYDPTQDDRDDEEVDFRSGKVIYLTIGHIVGWASPPELISTSVHLHSGTPHAKDSRPPRILTSVHMSGVKTVHSRSALSAPSPAKAAQPAGGAREAGAARSP
jgi:hypothetical protein